MPDLRPPEFNLWQQLIALFLQSILLGIVAAVIYLIFKAIIHLL
jgi:hypothetical protein